MKKLRLLLKETLSHWRAQNPARMSASLSYFAIFSIAPLFILLISLAGIFFSADIVQNKLLFQIGNLAGQDVANFISDILVKNMAKQQTNILTGLVSFSILLYGATGVFRELSYSMGKMWETEDNKKPRRTKGLKQILIFAKNHIPILLLVFFLAMLFVASILSGFSLQILGDHLEMIYPNAFSMFQLLEPIISFIFVAVFFGSIYRVLPKIKLPWNEIAFGASITALVFLISELFIGYYLGYHNDNAGFGPAGSFIGIMLWVYLSAQIFFLGAAFTFTYSKRYGFLKKHSK